MKGPVGELIAGAPLDERMRQKIIAFHKGRGKKALDIVDQERVHRHRDFFVVTGDTAEYVIEDEFCSCDDFMHRGGVCAHILAVKIARATGAYSLTDTWYYEHLR